MDLCRAGANRWIADGVVVVGPLDCEALSHRMGHGCFSV